MVLAVTLILGGHVSDASALALGRLSVQSALGEPLRADIDLPDISESEAATLRASVAPAAAFRAAGLEYGPSVSGLQINLLRRPDGRMYLRLSNERAVNDPFIDLILEVNWSAGRIVRDYTMLFDPPNLRAAAVPAPIAAQIPAAPAPAPAPAPSASPAPAAAPAPARAGVAAAAASRTPAPRPAAAAPARAAAAARPVPGTPAASGGQQVKVQAGDTAGRIAANSKPASVSLDQMLVALLRSNPDAFIGGNINRLRSGAVLNLPTAEQAQSVSTTEATQTVIAQSRDFNEFRRRLAEGAPSTQVAAAERSATGKVQTQVDDKKPAPAAPDRLTLSKGAVAASAADKIAREREAKEAAARTAQLAQNIAQLSKLGAASATAAAGTPPAAAAGSGAARPGVTVPVAAVPASVPAAPRTTTVATPSSMPKSDDTTPTVPLAAPGATASASAAVVAASAATSAAAPAASATSLSAPVAASASGAASATPARPASAAAKSAPVEPGLVDDLLESPLVPVGAGALIALLLGLGLYRARQRKKSSQVDSSFLESRLQPDSFFGASGGQRVDTNENSNATGSSMVYSPSQLDAAGDVDPVAEADVYLAYGRDLQAEEILKEAMRATPTRVAVHAKLLEIYAKRRDAKGFEFVATEAFSLTHGDGPEWERICELGRDLDADNALYRPGGQPSGADDEGGPGFVSSTLPQPLQAQEDAAPPAPDLDLDLDFSIGDGPAAEQTYAMPLAPSFDPDSQSTVAMEAMPQASDAALDMDFSVGEAVQTTAIEPLPAMTPPPFTAPVAEPATPDFELPQDNALDFSLDAPAEPPATAAVPAAPTPPDAPDSGMIEFDLDLFAAEASSQASPQRLPPAQPDFAIDPGPTLGAPLAAADGLPDIDLDADADAGEDPLATKLALAEEFQLIGDTDGARTLAAEVAAEASGSLQARAQRLLADLG
ncbi:MAG: FimV/HubP family polar landmark protein [Burkholderiaceae bacterium]|nr:FimV/HubP family polar landmark protein [Burkholderiaceae bacterium]MDO9089525.1 FimV/HubP family polar landmark protein [Burkholderiaceae bacterium]